DGIDVARAEVLLESAKHNLAPSTPQKVLAFAQELHSLSDALRPDVVPHEIGWADAMAIGGWVCHYLPETWACRIYGGKENDNINFRNILAKIVSQDGDCQVVNDADARPVPEDVDVAAERQAAGIVVRGVEQPGRELAKLLSGLGMKASWGSRPPEGGQIQLQ